ncbi:MAG: hypothetical protein IPO60_12180 [Flavobacteriales bacterium]|nr:hypothetical protein [Flavobacteriales bacterium]
MKPWLNYALIGTLALVIDVAVYLCFGLLLMSYEDFHDGSRGGMWKSESMDRIDLAAYFGLIAWHVLNLVAVAYVAYRLIKRYKVRKTTIG